MRRKKIKTDMRTEINCAFRVNPDRGYEVIFVEAVMGNYILCRRGREIDRIFSYSEIFKISRVNKQWYIMKNGLWDIYPWSNTEEITAKIVHIADEFLVNRAINDALSE